MNGPKNMLLPSPNFGTQSKIGSMIKPYRHTTSLKAQRIHERPSPTVAANVSLLRDDNSTIDAKFDVKETSNVPLCESCDMELQNVNELRLHYTQHENCPVEGCGYRGHPTVMDKHVVTLHSSGLFEQCKKLCTPEEIAIWREERRRKYPSAKNILIRQKAIEQQQKRGERLESNKSRFGKIEDRKRAKKHIETHSKSSKFSPHVQTLQENENNTNKVYKDKKRQRTKLFQKTKFNKYASGDGQEIFDKLNCVEQRCCNVLMFKGTNQLKNYRHMKCKTDGEVNALTNFLGMYGTDNEDEELYSENEDNMDNSTKQELNISTVKCLELEDKTPNIKSNSIPNSGIVPMAEYQTNVSLPIKKSMDFQLDDKSPNEAPSEAPNEGPSEAPNETSNESSNEGPNEAPIERISNEPSLPPKQTQNVKNETNSISSSKFGQRCIKSYKIYNQSTGLNYRKKRLRIENTMLQKLLASDIRHERNILLQCVRHVCENNFFNVEQNLNK